MKTRHAAPLLGFLLILPLAGQTDIPTNPLVPSNPSKGRSIGGDTNTGATLDPAKPDIRNVTYVVLSGSRMWTSADGKPLDAKLIAFEDMTVTTPAGSTQPVAPVPPANPTVVKDGKVRLLVKKKPVTLALERLSEVDRTFVENIRSNLARKAAAGK